MVEKSVRQMSADELEQTILDDVKRQEVKNKKLTPFGPGPFDTIHRKDHKNKGYKSATLQPNVNTWDELQTDPKKRPPKYRGNA